MPLRRLQVSDFRCVQTAELVLDPTFTLISGPNASGKTSLLEAIYVLSRGRSFRTRRLDNLIRASTSRFVVFGEVNRGERIVGLGVEGTSEGMRARLAGERVKSLSDLTVELPVQIIDPEVHRLIEEGPARRRRFLDWGVFHVEHSFVVAWQDYHVALRQRNAALRGRHAKSGIGAWDRELVRLGTLIDVARRRYVDSLDMAVREVARSLLGLEVRLGYRAGWSREMTFAEALEQSWGPDLESGWTHVGPHRAELGIRLDGSSVKERISRGQQKLLAAALLVSQINLFPSDLEARPTLMLDDPAAELDSDRLLGLIREVARASVQLVVTSLNPDFKGFGLPGRRYIITGGVLVEG